MHFWGTYVHWYIKYEVSMFKLVAQMTPTTIPTTMTNDRQSMIVFGTVFDKPNEPEKTS